MVEYYFGGTSLKRLSTTKLAIQHIFKEAIKSSPIDFGIPEFGGKRTDAEQKYLYDNKKSKCDGKVKLSYHQSGLALDIYAYVNGKASWDDRYLTLLAGHIMGVAKRLGYDLKWGGDFDKDFNLDEGDSWDKGHFELHLD